VASATVFWITGLLYRKFMQFKMALSPAEEKEINKIQNRNITKLTIDNPSKNSAMDVKVTLTALVYGKIVRSSPPMDGSIDWQVQAG